MVASSFVSADGRHAAVQGDYVDGAVQHPMLVILEIRAGRIVAQYNFVAMDRNEL
jgi:hypothetical protein